MRSLWLWLLPGLVAGVIVFVAGSRGSTSSSCRLSGHGLFVVPDRSKACTPGEWIKDRDLSAAHVCARGYNPRPGLGVTGPLKRAALRLYGLPAGAGRSRESDHLFPVWLGGATSLRNLWPEPDYVRPVGYDLNPKDRLEFALFRLVCERRSVSVEAARRVFEGDWRAGFSKYVEGK